MTQIISIKRIYDELKKIEKMMATKQEIESLKDTIEIMSNFKTMKQIAGSMKDIEQGKFKEISSVKDLLSDM